MSRMPLIAKAARVQGLTPPQKLTLMMLSEYADADGRCFPSIETLAADTGHGERTIQRAINALVAEGLLTVEAGGGRGRSNRYRVSINPARVTGFKAGNPVRETVYERRGIAETPSESPINPVTVADEPLKNPPLVLEADASNTHAPPQPQPKPDDRFAEFWTVYAHKVARGAAVKAWAKALKRAPPDRIIAGAARYAATRNPQYVAHAATWLNAERWDDDPAASQHRTGGTRNERTTQGDRIRDFFLAVDAERNRRAGGSPADDAGGDGGNGPGDVVDFLDARAFGS